MLDVPLSTQATDRRPDYIVKICYAKHEERSHIDYDSQKC